MVLNLPLMFKMLCYVFSRLFRYYSYPIIHLANLVTGFIHKTKRDICWSNIMQSYGDATNWFIIDWEDASRIPTKAAPYLSHETHAPQVFTNNHGPEVDIWAVGRLITQAGISDLPGDLCAIGERMINGSILSATQAIQELDELDTV
ncbi:hypothetical protein AMATHDRAFT_50016 [Amanita thiersii Skay4041]|uniref:Protein kinase domain-containing protein n=1 Tax=Amanita thiersii Skay4041 TaxID=703135 RepID=A0A2A9N9W0_9AGAR|nr:hypothetical protein AMATHDRAFT_50016 [Amanita thiersii Skay4041]